jgi:hypothetical protein
MVRDKFQYVKYLLGWAVSLALVMTTACSRQSQPTVKQMAPGQQFSGFLSSYDKLKPNPKFDGTLSYANADVQKNLHKYFAVIVEPVEVYLATEADPAKFPDRGRAALAAYFEHAIRAAVSDAFPVVLERGPLVLRLRCALIGVDVGSAVSQKGNATGALERELNIGKVGAEMELVDSETGEQIAAAVDRRNLGDGAVIGSVSFSRDERFRAAKRALDGWAARLREFLDSAHELSPEDISRVERSNQPYGTEVQAK